MNNIHLFFTPHNPLMISKIGEEHSKKLDSSIKALKDLRKKIYDIDPDKIIILSPLSLSFNNIIINQSEEYLISFKSFGDLSLEFKVEGDLNYTTRLKDFLRFNKFDVNLFSEEKVDHKSFVPFYYLNKYHISSRGFENKLEHNSNIKNEFVVIYSSQKDLDYHWKFGQFLVEFLSEQKEEIVVIGCGDLLGFSKKEDYSLVDEILDFIQNEKYSEIIGLERKLKKGSYLGIKPFMMMAPLILKMKLKSNILAVDKEFKEAYLTAEFI